MTEQEYLYQWRDQLSKTLNITENTHLGYGAPNSIEDKETFNLLRASAAGTKEFNYLDPIPFVNLLGKVYTDIITTIDNYIAFGAPARTDALKMNRDNMDYTLFDPEKEAEKGKKFKLEGNNSDSFYSGLNLLMPQYQRRVEVEDLNENFWVLSVTLDAVLKALWGPYGLIDVIKRLIVKIEQIERLLGLNNITNIELLHEGSNDLYFDMYSRFNLSGLSLKIKSHTGERIIKDIFTGTTDKVDRQGTTPDGYDTRAGLFDEIQDEICRDVAHSANVNDIIYDSDLISSADPTQKGYLSLTTVLDAINDRIVSNNTHLGNIIYEGNSELNDAVSEMLKLVDENSDGKITVSELSKIAKDLVDVSDFKVDSINVVDRFMRYKKAYDYLSGLSSEAQEELRRVLVENGVSEGRANLEHLFDFKKVTVEIPYDQLHNITESEGQVIIDEGKKEIASIRNYIETYRKDIMNENGNSVMYVAKDENGYDFFQGLSNELIELYNLFTFEDSNDSNNENAEQSNSYYVYVKIQNIIDKFDSGKTEDKEVLYVSTEKPSDQKDEDGKYIEYVDTYPIIYFDFSKEDKINGINSERFINKQKYIGVLNYVITTAQLLLSGVVDGYFKESSSYCNPSIIDNDNYVPEDVIPKFEESHYKSILKDFFDTRLGYGGLFDAIYIAEGLISYKQKTEYPAGYVDRVTEIRHSYLSEEFLYSGKINGKLSIIQPKKTGQLYSDPGGVYGVNFFRALFQDIHNYLRFINEWDSNYKSEALLISEECVYSDDSSTRKELIDRISRYFFKPADSSGGVPLFETEIATPTLQLLILLAQLALKGGIPHGGHEIIPADDPWITDTTENNEYGLFGNIVVFLYDANSYYYESNEENIAGLYSIEGKVFSKQKLILDRTALKTGDKIFPLFIKRQDLVNGEIIQLRFTQKEKTTENNFGDSGVKPYQINFSQLMNNIETGSKDTSYIVENKNPKTFLSLHNCFADILGQYNFRTTLFFKDTTPFFEGEKTMPISLDDWFRNGISCTYFRPQEFVRDDGTIAIRACVKEENLKIRASMIAKKEPYVDNSFISETITQIKDEKGANGEEVSPPKTKFNRVNRFTKDCAYFAAMRDNLIFYASPPQNEYGQFIHSPGRMLLSPNVKPHIDSIQSPRVTTSSVGKENWYCLDVLNKDIKTCTLDDIKDMLYRNAYGDYPLHVEIIFGRRNVNNYIKKKELDYIVIDREKGTRHQTYGPTSVGLSISKGYLHSQDGIATLKEVSHTDGQIEWYQKPSTSSTIPRKLTNKNMTADDGTIYYNFPDANGTYGVVNVRGKAGSYTADNFMVRFYSSADSGKGFSTETEFNLPAKNINGESGSLPWRRPIFTTAYFFGIDGSGKKGSDGN